MGLEDCSVDSTSLMEARSPGRILRGHELGRL